ncbi:hypothetical protein Lepto7376_0242 [[Leptolyngbya] sp. PCC 7376]|uniref:hypothetical protein n=1 Tax=[Leptolyngbya] sp. PCC 7376 TaxID=111781 RepID=UPI00029F19A8|nr:hypothetical protein [[Leptolyngbya] sp. PCC 7376]AFY36686.1 hypothetical protein Lepto7376_0242 [[Leptolyngbya] sp. PCC 7376]
MSIPQNTKTHLFAHNTIKRSPTTKLLVAELCILAQPLMANAAEAASLPEMPEPELPSHNHTMASEQPAIEISHAISQPEQSPIVEFRQEQIPSPPSEATANPQLNQPVLPMSENSRPQAIATLENQPIQKQSVKHVNSEALKHQLAPSFTDRLPNLESNNVAAIAQEFSSEPKPAVIVEQNTTARTINANVTTARPSVLNSQSTQKPTYVAQRTPVIRSEFSKRLPVLEPLNVEQRVSDLQSRNQTSIAELNRPQISQQTQRNPINSDAFLLAEIANIETPKNSNSKQEEFSTQIFNHQLNLQSKQPIDSTSDNISPIEQNIEEPIAISLNSSTERFLQEKQKNQSQFRSSSNNNFRKNSKYCWLNKSRCM